MVCKALYPRYLQSLRPWLLSCHPYPLLSSPRGLLVAPYTLSTLLFLALDFLPLDTCTTPHPKLRFSFSQISQYYCWGFFDCLIKNSALSPSLGYLSVPFLGFISAFPCCWIYFIYHLVIINHVYWPLEQELCLSHCCIPGLTQHLVPRGLMNSS
jgi:hypothetical protein